MTFPAKIWMLPASAAVVCAVGLVLTWVLGDWALAYRTPAQAVHLSLMASLATGLAMLAVLAAGALVLVRSLAPDRASPGQAGARSTTPGQDTGEPRQPVDGQNAAAADPPTDAAQRLRDQTDRLASAVAAFKLGHARLVAQVKAQDTAAELIAKAQASARRPPVADKPATRPPPDLPPDPPPSPPTDRGDRESF